MSIYDGMTTDEKVEQVWDLLRDIVRDGTVSGEERWDHLMNINGWVHDLSQELDVPDDVRESGL